MAKDVLNQIPFAKIVVIKGIIEIILGEEGDQSGFLYVFQNSACYVTTS